MLLCLAKDEVEEEERSQLCSGIVVFFSSNLVTSFSIHYKFQTNDFFK